MNRKLMAWLGKQAAEVAHARAVPAQDAAQIQQRLHTRPGNALPPYRYGRRTGPRQETPA